MFPENTPISSNHSEDGPSCDVCGGLGVIRYEVALDDPRFGKLYPCPGEHPELDRERRHRLRELSNLQAYTEKTFENFETNIGELSTNQLHSLRIAYDTTKKFADEPDGWLLLEGTYGCGKTHLAAAVGNARLAAGDAVLFITAPDLLDHLRGAYGPSSEVGYDQTFDRIRNAAILILDDLGAENPSQWAQEKLFQLLNHRYSQKLPTVITTNADLDRLDARIRSRLLDANFVHGIKITAPDYRTFTQISYGVGQLSNIHLYREMVFETFDTQTNLDRDGQQNLERALNYAWEYAKNPSDAWLVFTGPYGTGKTHLAAAIAQYFQVNHQRAEDIAFITTPDLLDYLRVTFNPGTPVTLDKRLTQIRNTPLLILDDLGTESSTPWAKEKLFQIIDYRYVAKLPTVITTAKEIESLDQRLATRLLDKRRCVVFAITAPNFATRIQRR